MPDESKKSQDKKKNDPKEQRKPRNSRYQGGKQERRVEKVEESKSAPKVVPQKPPVYEDPGPEFYKNLKQETDEILKITEEESSKYKKKEIQSNWSKYETPIESYEEIEDHDVGADYEKLIQAPLSVGGHFQFKHEKSWDTNTGPSLYDKYFDIDMDNLSIAISTIPFYERNDIDISMFSETDITNMKNRAAKFNEKYRNCNKTHSSADVDKIENNKKIDNEIEKERSIEKDDINLDFSHLKIQHVPTPVESQEQIKEKLYKTESTAALLEHISDENVLESKSKQNLEVLNVETAKKKEIVENKSEKTKAKNGNKIVETEARGDLKPETEEKRDLKPETEQKRDLKTETKVAKDDPVVTNPVIESPEDLEKWLDDFLDG